MFTRDLPVFYIVDFGFSTPNDVTSGTILDEAADLACRTSTQRKRVSEFQPPAGDHSPKLVFAVCRVDDLEELPLIGGIEPSELTFLALRSRLERSVSVDGGGTEPATDFASCQKQCESWPVHSRVAIFDGKWPEAFAEAQLASRTWPLVRRLVWQQGRTSRRFSKFAARPEMANVSALTINGVANDETIEAIVSSPSLGQLTELDLPQCQAVTEAGFKQLAGSSLLPRLEVLKIGIVLREMEELAAETLLGRQLPRLRGLHLESAPKDALPLLEQRCPPGLRELTWSGSGIAELGAFPRLAGQLESLAVRSTKLGNDGCQQLLNSTHLAKLRRLLLLRTDVDADGLRGIQALTNLEQLELVSDSLGNEMWSVLTEVRPAHLTRLTLCDVGIS